MLYQRPREKLRDKGVGSLSITELLQALISSGNKTVSAARIAKNIVLMLEKTGSPRYDDLIQIPGLGEAKVAQIIAAIELGNRLQSNSLIPQPVALNFQTARSSMKRMLVYVTVDGAGVSAQERVESIPDSTQATLLVRKMFAQAIHDNAHSLVVGVGARSYSLDVLSGDTINIVKMIFDTASLLEIRVGTVWLVNASSQRALTRKAIQ